MSDRSPMGDLTQLLIWTTHGENCPMCDSLRGRCYPYDVWMSSGVWPGFHRNCNCTLNIAPDDTPISDMDIFGTDLDLYLESWYGPSILTWNPNWVPYNVYLTKELMEAHLSYGKQLNIGEVLRRMKKDFVGLFKRSNLWDHYFEWRVFRTVQHFQNIDGGYSGALPPLIRRRPVPNLRPLTGSTFHHPYTPGDFYSMLLPDSLLPWYPYQSYHQEVP